MFFRLISIFLQFKQWRVSMIRWVWTKNANVGSADAPGKALDVPTVRQHSYSHDNWYLKLGWYYMVFSDWLQWNPSVYRCQVYGYIASTLSWVLIGDIWCLNIEWNNVMLWKVGMKSIRMSVNLPEVCEQIREMCSWRDRCDMTLFNKEECSTFIEFLCTG